MCSRATLINLRFCVAPPIKRNKMLEITQSLLHHSSQKARGTGPFYARKPNNLIGEPSTNDRITLKIMTRYCIYFGSKCILRLARTLRENTSSCEYNVCVFTNIIITFVILMRKATGNA